MPMKGPKYFTRLGKKGVTAWKTIEKSKKIKLILLDIPSRPNV